MYHIFFIHFSVDGHLGCFYILAIVNSATMNIGVCVSFLIIVLSGYMSRSGIAGSYANSLVLGGNSILFSIMAVPIYIPCEVGIDTLILLLRKLRSEILSDKASQNPDLSDSKYRPQVFFLLLHTKAGCTNNSAVILETNPVFPEWTVAPLETQECLNLVSLKMKVVLLWWSSS